MDVAAWQSHRREAATPSGPVSYLDVGEGRAAVFVHGLLANGLLWRRVISAVASDQRRCIAIDLPGHGGTPAAPAGADVSLTGLAQRVIELCDYLGLERFDLVANDTGGAVAQIAAAHMADRLSTFTLTNCDTEGNTPPKVFSPITFAARLGVLPRVGPLLATRRRHVRGVLKVGYRHPGRLPDDVVDAYSKPVLGTADAARGLARIIVRLSSDDLAAVRPQLAELSVPTLIVWGSADVLFPPKWAYRLAELIPGTTGVHMIDGARMHLPDEYADEFVTLLCRHWATYGA